jgi:molybdate transport system substrate-binding protein
LPLKRLLLLVLLLAVFLIAGCSTTVTTVNVSAAASLKDAITEINYLYVGDDPFTKVVVNFGGSGTLQKQIENGAPVDVFISASAVQMDALQKQQLIIEGSRRNLLKNKVVLIVPADSTRGIADFKDLAGDKAGKIAVGDPKSVPAGQYAQQIFDKYAISDLVKPKLILGSDVRQVLTYVETSNVDAGVVFLTDAKISKKVKIVAAAPDEINAMVVYPVAIINSSSNMETAEDYVNFLFSETARAVFEKYGFIALGR